MGSRFLARRVVQALLTILFIVLLNFLLFRMMPGSPERVLTRNPNISAEVKTQLRAKWGLDKPLIPDQFVAFLASTVQGDFGLSYKYRGQPVTEVIGSRIWPTVILFGLGEVIAIFAGMALGAYAGWKRGGRVDYVGNGVSLVLYSTPYFVLGMFLLVVFATSLGWFPTNGMLSAGARFGSPVEQLLDFLHHLVLPLATVSLGLIGLYSILMRSSIIGTLSEDYVQTARAKGPSRRARAACPRAAQRAAPGRDGRRHPVRLRHLRRHHGRGRLQLAGDRDAHRGCARGARLPRAAGHLPAACRLGGGREPAGRPLLWLPRPTGADMTADAGAVDIGSVHRARLRLQLRRFRDFAGRFARRQDGLVGGLILLVFVILAIAPDLFVGPLENVVTASGTRYDPPSAEHIFGTDRQGRDMLNLTVHGTRVSMVIGLLATVITVFIGALVGITSGFLGGRLDTFLMRITDFFLVLPTFVLALILAPILLEIIGTQSEIFGMRTTLIVIVVVIGITSWAATARIIRSQTLSLRERPFVDRARVIGASSPWIMRRHILPNVLNLIVANTVLTFAGAVLTETTLSFIGLGDPFQPSWGQLLNQAQADGAAGLGAWWVIAPPGIAIILVVLAFTLVGNALDDILNPRLRGRR